MANLAKLIMAVVFSLSLSAAFAQKPKPAPAKPGTQKFTPPKLTSKLGARSDSATVLLEEATQLISLPLTVTDDKKNVYTISSYQAMYKRKAVTEDDEMSGKVTPIVSDVIEHFKTTPLSPIWIKTLTEQLRAGEELYFFDIVVKGPQGRLLFAPDIKLKIK